MDTTTPRRRRWTSESAYSALLDAGRELLLRDGFGGLLDSVTFNDAFHEAGIPRSTAYKAWADAQDTSGPAGQEFALAVLVAAALEALDTDELGPTVEAVIGSLASSELAPDHQRIDDAIRAGADANLSSVNGNPLWRIVATARVALTTIDPAERPAELMEALRRSEQDRMQLMITDLYMPYAEMFGLRLRRDDDPAAEWRRFASSVSALADGLLARVELDLSPDVIDEDSGGWSLFARAFRGLLNEFFVSGDGRPPTAST